MATKLKVQFMHETGRDEENYGMSFLHCAKCLEERPEGVSPAEWARLTLDGTDDTQSADGSHEWGDNSLCVCRTCGYSGLVESFRTNEREERDEQ